MESNEKEKQVAPTSPRPNLYLVGFMGTGKSAVGRRLSTELGYGYIDSDHWIEEVEGMPIPEIFARRGEAYFRECERRFVESGHSEEGMVVSCGGGLVIQPGMLERLHELGQVFCLFASAETILERTAHQRNRPLLEADNRKERIQGLLAEREPLYRKAGTQVVTDRQTIAEVVQRIKRLYLEELNQGKAGGR